MNSKHPNINTLKTTVDWIVTDHNHRHHQQRRVHLFELQSGQRILTTGRIAGG